MTANFECALPTQLKIGPHLYKINTSEIDLLQKMVEEKTKGLMGHCNTGRTEILINTAYVASQQRDTLLHEVMHAIVYDTALHLDWDSAREEEVVSRLTPSLLAVLRRNPALVACLLEDS